MSAWCTTSCTALTASWAALLGHPLQLWMPCSVSFTIATAVPCSVSFTNVIAVPCSVSKRASGGARPKADPGGRRAEPAVQAAPARGAGACSPQQRGCCGGVPCGGCCGGHQRVGCAPAAHALSGGAIRVWLLALLQSCTINCGGVTVSSVWQWTCSPCYVTWASLPTSHCWSLPAAVASASILRVHIVCGSCQVGWLQLLAPLRWAQAHFLAAPYLLLRVHNIISANASGRSRSLSGGFWA